MQDNFLYMLFLSVIHLLGLLSALHAIMKSHSSQGAIAWAVSLLFFPYVALILYWIAGRNHLGRYITARQNRNQNLQSLWQEEAARELNRYRASGAELFPYLHSVEKLARVPLLRGNSVQLLLNGDASFDSMLEGLRAAQKYICFQFYIVNDDRIGRDFQQVLIQKAQEGVRTYFLYDQIGSLKLSKGYIQTLREVGVECHNFSAPGLAKPMRINFRNHRKLLIVDGHTVWLGGHNIGDEYRGQGPLGFWRDTHLKISGPAVLACQLAFVEDWHWVTNRMPQLDWKVQSLPDSPGLPASSGESTELCSQALSPCHNVPVLIILSGPADSIDTTRLMFVQTINTARKRIWLATPYFVPDDSVISALVLAALRGVDVRIMMPDNPDHWLVYLAAFSYFREVMSTGAKIYRYRKGFLHHKLFILDDFISAVGTANLDNRSFHLNFEITAMSADSKLHQQMCKAFEEDMQHCYQVDPDIQKGFFWHLLVDIARLFTPLL